MMLNQLALLGWTSVIKKDGCTVSEGDFSIHREIRNGLCVWSQTPRVPHNADALFACAAPKKLSFTDWHERLGHVSKDTLAKFGDSAIEDLHLGLVEKSEDQHSCKPCIHGKQYCKPFPSRDRRRGKPLELVHSDLCESNVESIGGGKHVLTFTDDHTNHGTVYVLKNKNSSTVLDAFKEYQAWAERQCGHKIKELRTDRGTEYMGDMIEFVKSHGIEHNPTAGYSPQSNGIAERMNRTLFEMACTMLDASGAPLELWADAILSACHIRNRLPSRTLEGKSPYEAWNGRKPTVGHIRKWGCKVYRLINKKTGRKKFQKDFKSVEGYLVGYELPGGVNYRIYHPETKAFKVSRDVLFDEEEFFNTRHITGHSDKILPSTEISTEDNADHETEHESEEVEPQNENAAPIVYDEIIVEPPPPSPPTECTPSATGIPQTKPPNRRTRRQIAKAFKAVVKGNWSWPRNFREGIEAEDAEGWKAAIQKEYDSIMKNHTWDLVPRPKNAKVVKSRWVLRIKDNDLHKARFCAKGFTQRWGEDYDETYAPVAKYTSIRTLFALIAGHNAKVHQMDVNTAFLNSNIAETVYVEQPEGYEVPGKEDYIRLLRKTLYGLKQSPRAWFQLITTVLVDFDFQQCESDPCIF